MRGADEIMRKRRLKSGMSLVCRDGETRLVLLEIGTIHSEGGTVVDIVGNYNDDLTHTRHTDKDVMCIKYQGDVLWRRPRSLTDWKQEETERLAREMQMLCYDLLEVQRKTEVEEDDD